MIDVFIVSPYTHFDKSIVAKRVEQVEQYFASLIKEGKIAYSTIAMMTPINNKYNIPDDWAYWKNHCETMIGLSKEVHVLMLDGWSESTGVQAEIEIAKRLNKTIVMVPYMDPDVVHVPSIRIEL